MDLSSSQLLSTKYVVFIIYIIYIYIANCTVWHVSPLSLSVQVFEKKNRLLIASS